MAGEGFGAGRDCNPRPAEVNLPTDHEFQPEIAVLEAFAYVRPLVRPVGGTGTSTEVSVPLECLRCRIACRSRFVIRRGVQRPVHNHPWRLRRLGSRGLERGA